MSSRENLLQHSIDLFGAPNAAHVTLKEQELQGVFRMSFSQGMIFANDILVSMFGYHSQEEMLRQKVSAFFVQPFEHDFLVDTLQRQLFLEKLVLFRRKDGTNFWGLLKCIVHQLDIHSVFDGFVIDTGQEVRNVLGNEKTDAVEKLSIELDRLVYSASHDLRSPISTMKGLVALLKIEKETSRDTVLAMMSKSLERMETLVTQLAGFAKNRHEFVSSELIDLDKLISSVWQGLSGHPNHHLFEFSVSIKARRLFYSDPKRLELLFYNVIINSLDFCDLEKDVRPSIKIIIRGSPSSWKFEIEDNGRGIPPAHIDHVFEMFYRASIHSNGVGLGLYLTKEAILKLKGSIKIESEFGKKTRVTINIPNGVKGKLIHKKRDLLTRSKN